MLQNNIAKASNLLQLNLHSLPTSIKYDNKTEQILASDLQQPASKGEWIDYQGIKFLKEIVTPSKTENLNILIFPTPPGRNV